jgi:hypothetical protein
MDKEEVFEGFGSRWSSGREGERCYYQVTKTPYSFYSWGISAMLPYGNMV